MMLGTSYRSRGSSFDTSVFADSAFVASAFVARALALSFALGRDQVDHMTLLCRLLLQKP